MCIVFCVHIVGYMDESKCREHCTTLLCSLYIYICPNRRSLYIYKPHIENTSYRVMPMPKHCEFDDEGILPAMKSHSTLSSQQFGPFGAIVDVLC